MLLFSHVQGSSNNNNNKAERSNIVVSERTWGNGRIITTRHGSIGLKSLKEVIEVKHRHVWCDR